MKKCKIFGTILLIEIIGDFAMDPLTPEQRSMTMARVKGRNTSPEMLVRRLLHRLGYRYRLQGKEIPGNPDIIFKIQKKAIFVHGCFWHGHDCAHGRKLPKTNEQYWLPKLARNQTRDAVNQEKLREMGWDFLILWECQLKDSAALTEKIKNFLGDKPNEG